MYLNILLICTLLSSSLISISTTPLPFKKIYAFGDSYTDTGNTKTSTGPTAFNYVSNPPYGETFFHHPTNRYCDGRILLDFIANAISLPFVPAYRDAKADRSHGVNFAVGGATAIRTGFFLKNNILFDLVRQSLQTQIRWFTTVSEPLGCKDLKSTPKECRSMMDDALVWVGEIGANDYTNSIGSSIPERTIQQKAINSTIGFLQVMLNKGAKYIVMQGLPMVGCTTYTFALASPDDRDELGCVASSNRRAYSHNMVLQARLNTLRKQYPEATIVYLDYYSAHKNIFTNYKKYGFTQQYKACCGYGGGEFNFNVLNTCGMPSSTSCSNPGEYINWDGAHLTEAAYKVLSGSIMNGSFCTPSFTYLLDKKMQSS